LPEAAARGHLESSSWSEPCAGEKRRDLVGALDKANDIFLTYRIPCATVFQNEATGSVRAAGGDAIPQGG